MRLLERSGGGSGSSLIDSVECLLGHSRSPLLLQDSDSVDLRLQSMSGKLGLLLQGSSQNPASIRRSDMYDAIHGMNHLLVYPIEPLLDPGIIAIREQIFDDVAEFGQGKPAIFGSPLFLRGQSKTYLTRTMNQLTIV